ncbi:Ribosome-associated ATPase [Lactococcus lactis]|nr:Ribosome-associated ATPase [Lactococcus lactis]
MIEIRELTKMYGKQYALNHLSLTIPEGQIFGFLGHNGGREIHNNKMSDEYY